MKRMVMTIIGLAIVAGGAIWISKAFLKPAADRKEADKRVLSGAYDARLESCVMLEDSELPEGIEPPGIASDLRYVQVIVLFPEVQTIKGKGEQYVLDLVNGKQTEVMTPVASRRDVEAEGVFLTLTYQTNENFEYARLRFGEAILVERVELQ